MKKKLSIQRKCGLISFYKQHPTTKLRRDMSVCYYYKFTYISKTQSERKREKMEMKIIAGVEKAFLYFMANWYQGQRNSMHCTYYRTSQKQTRKTLWIIGNGAASRETLYNCRQSISIPLIYIHLRSTAVTSFTNLL